MNRLDDVIKAVQSGISFKQVARECDVPLSTVAYWCNRNNVKSKHARAPTKATDEEILSMIHKRHVVSEKELKDTFDYSSVRLYRRLNRLSKNGKIQHITISGGGIGKVFFRGYLGKSLYYCSSGDLNRWIRSKLPKNLSRGLKRSISYKMHVAGIPFEFKKGGE